jgi:hypothetical protein
MPDECLPQVQADAIRVALLAANGAPLPGAGNLYVSDALTTLTITPVYKDGTEIEEENAAGEVCVSYQGDPSLKWAEVEIELCTPDPYLEAMLGSGTVLDLGGDVPPGFAMPAIGKIQGAGVSIELWSKRVNNGDLDPDYPYAWYAYPKIVQLRPGARNHANESIKPTFTGRALENVNWQDGPTNDWPAASDRFGQWVPTITLPTVQCGPQVLAAS